MSGIVNGIGKWALGSLTSNWKLLALAGGAGVVWDKISGTGYTDAFGKAVGLDFSNEGLQASALALWDEQLWPKVEGVIKGATQGDFSTIALFYLRDLYKNTETARVTEIMEKIKNWDFGFVQMIWDDMGTRIDPAKAATFLGSTAIGQAISNGGDLTGNTLLNVATGMVITGAVHFAMKKVTGQKDLNLTEPAALSIDQQMKLDDALKKTPERGPDYGAPTPIS